MPRIPFATELNEAMKLFETANGIEAAALTMSTFAAFFAQKAGGTREEIEGRLDQLRAMQSKYLDDGGGDWRPTPWRAN